jgi:rabenosyn-5
MFPLKVGLGSVEDSQTESLFFQSLPTEKLSTGLNKPDPFDDAVTQHAEDFELAERLQALLEQEVLLETFIQEAEARRKFEDVKTLKSNLNEIRGEIVKISGSTVSRASRTRR